jgi:flagellin-specific chaperone FliS
MLYAQIAQRLNDELAKAKDYITSGHIDNFEKYKYHIGRIQGIQDSLDIYLNMIRGASDD